MSYDQYIKAGTIASGATTSGNLDLVSYRGQVYVYVTTMSTAAALTVQDSPDGGTTFYNKFVMANTATTQVNAVVIGSAVGTSGGMIRLEGGGRFLRFVASAVVSGGVGFTVVGYD